MSGLGSTTQAANLFALSAPRSPDVHLIESEAGHQLFVADGSRLFRLDRKTAVVGAVGSSFVLGQGIDPRDLAR